MLAGLWKIIKSNSVTAHDLSVAVIINRSKIIHIYAPLQNFVIYGIANSHQIT